jgi:hypothetical protein
MKENVGAREQAVRALIGPLLMGRGLRRRHRLTGLAALVAGAMITGTAITRVCPVNRLLGINNRRDRPHAGSTEQHLHGAAAEPDWEKSTGMPAAAARHDDSAQIYSAPD